MELLRLMLVGIWEELLGWIVHCSRVIHSTVVIHSHGDINAEDKIWRSELDESQTITDLLLTGQDRYQGADEGGSPAH